MEYIKTKQYGDYYVDFFKTDSAYETWIYHKGYGIKSLMFGLPIEQQTFEMVEQVVDNNIDDEIEFYHDEYEH